MKLSSLLEPGHIVLHMQAKNLHEAVCEILDKVERFRPNVDRRQIVDAVMRREQQGSTALELGIALPHARIPGLEDFFVFLGIPATPLAECGVDGQNVSLVFLVLASDKKNMVMLQSMAAIGLLGQKADVLARLREARDKDSAWRIIDESGVTVKRVLQARDLMRTDCARVSAEMPVQKLLDLMFETGAHESVVVSPSGAVVGCVTSEEILEAALPGYMSILPGVGFLNEFEPFEHFFQREARLTVGEIMNKKPLVVESDEPLIQVAFRLKQERKRFAFVQEAGRFVGVVDRNDLLSRVLRA